MVVYLGNQCHLATEMLPLDLITQNKFMESADSADL